MNPDITFFGQTNFRNEQVRFGIRPDDRRRHIYIIGQTGTGKTTLMKNMAFSDIEEGRGFCVIDPHGEFADRILDYIPENRVNDVIYFNPSDTTWPIAFNVIEEVPPEYRFLIASGLMGVFKKIWPDVWSARMEYILNNTLLALLEYPGSTLLGINRMLSDKDYRQTVVDHITDPVVKAFWNNEFAKYHDRFASEAIAPIQNKAGQFISNPLIRNIIGQKESKINFREIMDEGKILIVNLSKGLIGEDNSALLGALVITEIQQAAMSRVDVPEEQRKDFFLYVDEFQNFSTDSFANILSEARKYRLNLALAHQYITQLNETVRDAVFGNVGTLVVYRIGADDAEFLEREFTPDFMAQDLVNIPNYNFCIKLMVDGYSSRPFTGINIPPAPPSGSSFRERIIDRCRELFSTPSEEVIKHIAHWAALDFSRKGEPVETKEHPFSAVCDVCGTKTAIPFAPDSSRPIYCKNCYDKMKRGEIPALKEKPKHTSSISMVDLLKKEPTSLKKKPRDVSVDEESLKQTITEALDKELKKDDTSQQG